MISINHLLKWWNTPFAWIFAILLLPIGLIFAIIDYIYYKKNKIFGNMYSFWATALRPGFYFGLFLSIFISGIFIMILPFKYKK